jgi:plasmid rolling circle replication initiator protein Rep
MTKDNKFKDELQERFKPKKEKNMKVRDAFIRLSLYGRAERLENCGVWLKFLECADDGWKKLIGANFCRDRLCPMCNWRRSRLLFRQIMDMLHKAREKRKMKFLHLTLTVRNVKSDELDQTVDMMFKGFKALTEKKHEFDKAVVGWIRNLEITYNSDRDDYHPHFHCLLGVKPSYFDGDNYVKHADWVKLWQKACKLDYEPSVSIQRARPKKEGQTEEVAVLEIAKYSVKDTDYIRDTEAETDKVIEVLANVLHGRRLIGFGKLFRKVRAELKQEDLTSDEADLVLADGNGCECPICKSTLAEMLYSWNYVNSNYVRDGKQ